MNRASHDSPRNRHVARSFLVSGFDLLAVVLCWQAAYQLRFNFAVPADFAHTGWISLAWALPLHAVMFRAFGLYRGMWIFASLPDLVRIVRAIATAAVLSVAIVAMLHPTPPVPRSVLVSFPVFLLMAMGGARAAYRVWREYRLYGMLASSGKPALLIGVGDAAANVLRQLHRSSEWRIVGILDDNPNKLGRELLGHCVLGTVDELETWAPRLKAQHVIVAMPSASNEERKRIFALCLKAGVHAMMVPSLSEMMQGGARGMSRENGAFREVRMEDLLGRDPVAIDCPHLDGMIAGRTVLVTGAGGSIGSELCRQIALFRPARLVAYEANEFALYQLVEEFSRRFPEVALVPVAGDVRDALWLDETFGRYAPAVVFHAAAYKHVPLMEEDNAWQAITNNVLGTWRVAKAAAAHRVPKFVMISTDKAVNPTNVMGATKRLAEMICQCVQTETQDTAFCSVRFGNVLGSTGSVVPKFREQIAAGGPVTVTHPEITRYFMSIPEAAQLVLQAATMGKGGEIFVLDMGEPVKIANLARDMIRLSGASDIQIEFTGLRPGEKLYEELLADTEQTLPTHHEKLRVAQARCAEPAIVEEALAWARSTRVPSPGEIKRELRRWIPEYVPYQRPNLQVVASAQRVAEGS
jgi:FlaA1/EpsC-like NDP-sugar epimerase